MEILARPDSTRHVDWQKNEADFTWTLKDNDGKKTYAEYNFFGAASERSKYRLSLNLFWFVICAFSGGINATHVVYMWSRKMRERNSIHFKLHTF